MDVGSTGREKLVIPLGKEVTIGPCDNRVGGTEHPVFASNQTLAERVGLITDGTRKP
jgi:hypothetical protein